MPGEDAQSSQRVPTAATVVALFEREVNFAGMGVLQEPSSIGLLLRTEESNCFVQPLVRFAADRAEVVEGAQHVVVPANGEGQLQPGGVDDGAGALAPKQFALQKVLFATAARSKGLCRTAGCLLIRQEPFEDVDGGIEGRTD